MNKKEVREGNRDYNQNKIDFKKHELVKLETFTMKSWNESMSDLFIFDYVYLWFLFSFMIGFMIIMIYYANKTDNWEKTIAETGSTNSRLDALYQSATWWDLAKGRIHTNFLFFVPVMFVKDLFVLISAGLRGVRIRSGIFMTYLVIDFIAF